MTDVIGVLRTAGNLRVSRFAVVGAMCAVVQLAFNSVALLAGASELAAYVLSFVLSAQLNFLLSDRFTWGNRRQRAKLPQVQRWSSYNLSTLGALAISSVAFAILSTVLPNPVAVLGGIATGAALTFLVGDRLVFAGRTGVVHTSMDSIAQGSVPAPSRAFQSELPAGVAVGSRSGSTGWLSPGGPDGVPGQQTLPGGAIATMLGSGIALFLPAYNEAENLPLVVAKTLAALRDLGTPHRVIIVDDGSQDDTAAVAAELAETYAPDVRVVSHPQNLGYGNALRSGFAAGFEEGWEWVAFMDADNQFDPQQIRDLLVRAYLAHVDLVAGVRVKRADNLMRRINGRLWHMLSRFVVGIREHDVDCGFKLVHRNVLDRIELTGTYAAVSPELLIKARRAGFRSAEVGVEHYPRTAGKQTGANLTVIIRSVLSLLRVRASLRQHPSEQPRRSGSRWGGAAGLGVVSALLSVAAFAYFAARGETLLYEDAISHLLIARRVVDGSVPGFGQLGAVWLPLPHLLLAPAIWIDLLFHSGIAGSVLSMVSFVVTAVYLFKTAELLTGSRYGGWLAGLLFSLSANALYLQATPMTETLMFAGMAVAVYHLTEWSRGERWQNLAWASLAVFVSSLTRYEGWVLLAAFVVAIAYIGSRRRFRPAQRFAALVFFGVLGALGVAGWLVWNQAIFGSFTEFISGEFAKSSLWVGQTDVAVGNLGVSLHTYALAVAHTVGLPLAVAAVAGLAAYLWRTRGSASSVAPLTLLIFLPFFVYALYSGQRPLHVIEITGDYYNTRFGLVMILPAAIFTAYGVIALTRWIHARRTGRRAGSAPDGRRRGLFVGAALVAGAAVLSVGGVALSGGAVTLQEPRRWVQSRADVHLAAEALADRYDGGHILMQGFGNEYVSFGSRVPVSEVIYEGSYKLWEPALTDPVGQQIKWIYMSRTDQDRVWQRLKSSPALADYQLMFDDGTRVIYRQRA
jgi:putative flippase GtrA